MQEVDRKPYGRLRLIFIDVVANGGVILGGNIRVTREQTQGSNNEQLTQMNTYTVKLQGGRSKQGKGSRRHSQLAIHYIVNQVYETNLSGCISVLNSCLGPTITVNRAVSQFSPRKGITHHVI